MQPLVAATPSLRIAKTQTSEARSDARSDVKKLAPRLSTHTSVLKNGNKHHSPTAPEGLLATHTHTQSININIDIDININIREEGCNMHSQRQSGGRVPQWLFNNVWRLAQSSLVLALQSFLLRSYAPTNSPSNSATASGGSCHLPFSLIRSTRASTAIESLIPRFTTS